MVREASPAGEAGTFFLLCMMMCAVLLGDDAGGAAREVHQQAVELYLS